MKNFDTYYALQNYKSSEIRIEKAKKGSKKFKKYQNTMKESKKYLKTHAGEDWAFCSKNANLKLPEWDVIAKEQHEEVRKL